MNIKTKVFRIMNCRPTHGGKIDLILQSVINCFDFGSILVITKTVEPSTKKDFEHGDLFAMTFDEKTKEWEFSE